MRAKITDLGPNRCKLTEHDDDKYHVTTYWAPNEGGYVRDVSLQPGTLGRQVCYGLTYLGDTLTWVPGHERLVDLIRRERRREKRQERGDFNMVTR